MTMACLSGKSHGKKVLESLPTVGFSSNSNGGGGSVLVLWVGGMACGLVFSDFERSLGAQMIQPTETALPLFI